MERNTGPPLSSTQTSLDKLNHRRRLILPLLQHCHPSRERGASLEITTQIPTPSQSKAQDLSQIHNHRVQWQYPAHQHRQDKRSRGRAQEEFLFLAQGTARSSGGPGHTTHCTSADMTTDTISQGSLVLAQGGCTSCQPKNNHSTPSYRNASVTFFSSAQRNRATPPT